MEFIQTLKGRKFWYMLQYGSILKTFSCEISQLQKDNTIWFHLNEVSRVVKFLETESRMVISRDWEEGKMGS